MTQPSSDPSAGLPADIDQESVFRSLFAAYPDALLLVDQAGKSMANIVGEVSRVNDLIGKISASSVDQKCHAMPETTRNSRAAALDCERPLS